MDEIESEGFSAHGQNEPRTANPYLPKAGAWDEGWANRERQRLIHEVRREEAEHLPSFAAWVSETADEHLTTTTEGA